MADAKDLAEITRLLSAPLGEFIAAVGRGVAEAQQALDLHTVESFKAVFGDNKVYQELRKLGYQPTWYRIPEVAAEIYVTLSVSGVERTVLSSSSNTGDKQLPKGSTRPGRIQLYATPVDASYSNTYDYQLRACSQLKFRVVPVPGSGQAEGMKVVPKLDGQTYQKALAVLAQLAILHELDLPDTYYVPKGHEIIESTEPPAGSILPTGDVVVLKLKLS